MFVSLRILFESPYNKAHPIKAIYRFVYWKFIRVLKIKNKKIGFWGNNYFFINYDSFQSMWLMYNYIVDWEEFTFIHNYISKSSIVFDIGSNMGFYSIWMGRSLGPTGELHTFEPDHKNFERLKKNISINSLQAKVKLNQKAVSTESGLGKITMGLDGENHLITDESNIDTIGDIELISLDQYINDNQLSEIDFIKIDVEGFELNVLKGGLLSLSNKKIGVIQLEINETISNAGVNRTEIIDFVHKNGYQFYKYDISNNMLMPVDLTSERENYYISAAVDKVNSILDLNKGWKSTIMSL
jgi:FkbM family methyltransferase